MRMRLKLIGRCEAASQTILGYEAGNQEVLQIFAAAGFGSSAAHFEAAERLPFDDRAGDWAVDVEIAANQLVFGALDIHWAARVDSASERELALVGQLEGGVEVFCFCNRQHRAENFLLKEPAVRRNVGEDGRGHITGISLRNLSLPCEGGLFLARFNHFEDPALGRAVDDRSNEISRSFG